jgi:hypothetical protein
MGILIEPNGDDRAVITITKGNCRAYTYRNGDVKLDVPKSVLESLKAVL